jgi:hypothetical protein
MGSIPSRGNDGTFSLYHHIPTGSEAHPASHSMGTGEVHSAKVKWLRHEADHSSPSRNKAAKKE